MADQMISFSSDYSVVDCFKTKHGEVMFFYTDESVQTKKKPKGFKIKEWREHLSEFSKWSRDNSILPFPNKYTHSEIREKDPSAKFGAFFTCD
jgi:hypothetical protein